MNQRNKALVWEYWRGLNRGGHADLGLQVLDSDITWHGFQPLRHLNGSAQVRTQFWQPLLRAIPDLVRRPYVFWRSR